MTNVYFIQILHCKCSFYLCAVAQIYITLQRLIPLYLSSICESYFRVARTQMAWEDADGLGRHRQGTVVLPQTSLGQSSIAPWTDQPPPGGKKRN
jgi:hypothetical protein